MVLVDVVVVVVVELHDEAQKVARNATTISNLTGRVGCTMRR